jgi:RNA polymerase sigma-70 factor (ECF subfamily)
MTLSSTELLEETMPSGEPGDMSAVIARAQRGDSAAFATIYQAFSRRVTGLCHHILRERELAKDAAGDVFLRLRTSIATYDGSSAFERWLLRVASNHCVDLLRRRRLEQRWVTVEESPADPPSPAASPLTLLLAKESRTGMERAIAVLTPEYRLPIVLRYYADLSYDEIAAELDLEKNQVAGRIFRAKHMLRKLLEESAQ